MADDFISQDMSDWHAKDKRTIQRRTIFGAGALACVVIAAVGGWQAVAYMHRQADAAASQRYYGAVAAIQASHGPKAPITPELTRAASTLGDLADHGPVAMRGYAGLQRAALLQQTGDAAGAQAAWHVVADQAGLPAAQRQLATLLSLEAQAGHTDPATLRRGYEALAADVGPWQALAREQIAGLDLAPGATPAQVSDAKKILASLAQGANTPDGVRERAQMMLQTLGQTEGAG